MSLGDSTGIVSFADPSADPSATPVSGRSREEFPLTLLDDPGDAGHARAAIDAISFGGWTPIGAGLQRASTMLAGASAPRAILLISDGYENRAPLVADVLASWPTDLRVFTIALGPAADAPLLQSIATQTGGVFQSSPTALDLHLIYNQMRADMTDDGLVLNQAAVDTAQDGAEYFAEVEPAADWLTVTVSSPDRRPPTLCLQSPSGRSVAATDFGVSVRAGEGYVVFRVARPTPGRWRICPAPRSSPFVVAAFVHSPLRLQLRLPARLKAKSLVDDWIHARFGETRLDTVQARFRSRQIPHLPLPRESVDPKSQGWPDALPKDALSSVGTTLRPAAALPWCGGRIVAPRGLSRVELAIEGQLPGGARFHRVALRTVQIA